MPHGDGDAGDAIGLTQLVDADTIANAEAKQSVTGLDGVVDPAKGWAAGDGDRREGGRCGRQIDDRSGED